MAKLIRYNNPDGSFYYKNSETGEIVEKKQKKSVLPGLLTALGIVYFISSIIVSIIFFINSTVKVKTILGVTNQTNELVIGTGIIIIFQGLVIMLICLALAKILEAM